MSESNLDPVLGRVTSGIFILTVGQADRATGMLASWVMQAGFEPPMVSVAVKKGRYIEEWLTAGEPFLLNIVAEKQFGLLKHFGSGFDIGEPAFEGLETTKSECGVPALAECLGYLECEPVSHADTGDHRIFLAEVVEGKLLDEAKPMVHLRKSGKQY